MLSALLILSLASSSSLSQLHFNALHTGDYPVIPSLMNEFSLVLTLFVAPTAFSILIPPLVLEAPVSLAVCYDFRMDFQAQSFVKMGSSIR